MGRLLVILLVLGLWVQGLAQTWDGLVYPERGGEVPVGSARIFQNGQTFSGELLINDPPYPFDRMVAWPEGNGYRMVWFTRYMGTGQASGFFTSTPQSFWRMEWRLAVTSAIYGFPHRFKVYLTPR